MGKLLRRFAAIIASVLVVALAEPAVSRSVNINNSWLLPQNDFPVFYRHFRDRITWFEADAVCQFHHAQLVTVETNTQFETIRDYLKELDVTENVWIGLKRNSEASEFAWTNYQPLARGGFFREEVPSSENPVCVVTDPTANFKWHSLHCGGPEVASFVCELPVPYWASKSNGCIASTTKDMTVTFLPEEPAIQFVNECGDGITNKVTCKGNMKSSEIMENLTCPYSNAPSLKTILKSTSAEIITTTSSSESDLEDYAIEMATISQYNDETFQSLSKVIGRGLPQEMSIDQEPIKGTRSGFNTNGINSSVMGGVSETGTDVVSSTTVGTLNTTITQSTITIAPSTSNDPNTTIALNATTGIPITTTIAPNTTNHGLQGTIYQMPITTPSTKTTTITAEKPEQATTFTAETKATGSAVTTAERTPPIVQGSIFTTVPVSTVIRDTLAIKPRTTVTVDTIATSAAPTATATSTTMHSTTTKTAGRRHHHHGHHTSSPTFATTTEKIRTIAKIMAADQQPPSITPTTYAVTRLAEYVLRTTTATTRTTTGRPLFVSTSSPKIPYTMAIGRPMQTATPLANARVPITGSSDMAPVTTTPTSVGDVTTVAQHYRRFKKIDFPQMPLDDDYPFPYKPTPLVRTTTPIATTPTVTTTTPTVTTTTPTVTTTTRTVTTTTPKIKTTTPTVTTNITDSTAATINNTGYYAAINTGEIARRTSVKTIDVPHSTLKSVTTNTITTVTQTETTPAGRNDTTFATTSVMASTSTISDENDWNQIMNSSSQALPITTTDNKTGTTATTAPVVTTGHHKINYDTYTDHPSRSRHIIRPKQQHHHSYPYILYRLLG